jgi:hypothetical protein
MATPPKSKNTVRFHNIATIVDLEGNIMHRDLSTFLQEKKKNPTNRKQNKRHKSTNVQYNANQAFIVAKRLEETMKNEKMFYWRIRNEFVVDCLLHRNQMSHIAPKIHRLSDQSLSVLRTKLISK